MKNKKYFVTQLKWFVGIMVLFSIIWSIVSFFKTKSLLLDLCEVVFVFQGYLIYLYVFFGNKEKKWYKLILIFLISYLGIKLLDIFDWEIIMISIPVYLVFLILSITFYIYLVLKDKTNR